MNPQTALWSAKAPVSIRPSTTGDVSDPILKGPYGFEVNGNCQTCRLRRNGFFCQLTAPALKDFDALKFVSAYPQGALLFIEKQISRGVYVLCEGEVKLSISSREGKKLSLRIVKPGDVLGLAGTLADLPHEVTAETTRPSQVAFVRRDDFLRFLTRHPEAYLAVAKQLGAHYQVACEQLRTVALSASAPARLAKMLLDFSAARQGTKQGARFNWSLTHDEIGNFIGTTRETVTRTLSAFKSRHLVTLRGSSLLILDRAALESLAAA